MLTTLKFVFSSQTSLPNSALIYPTAYLTSSLGCLICISNLSCPKLGSSYSCSFSAAISTSVTGHSILPVASDKKLKDILRSFYPVFNMSGIPIGSQYIYNLTTSVHFCCHHPGHQYELCCVFEYLNCLYTYLFSHECNVEWSQK